MTSESAGQTDKFAEQTGMNFAYAYDKKQEMMRWFGVSGIPHAVLLDPSGQVVWRGSPSSLSSSTLEKHLEGALESPIWEWPSSAKSVRKALEKRQFQKALAAAEKLGDEGSSMRETILALVQARSKGMVEAHERGDYLAARGLAETFVKDFAGLPEGDKAKEVLAHVKKDSKAKAILKAQEKVLELRAEKIKKRKDVDSIVKKLEKIAEDLPGTVAAEQAAKLRDDLMGIRHKLKK